MKRIIYPIILLAALAFTACEDVIEVKLNTYDQNLYAVEAKITTMDAPYCYLYHALPVNSAENFAGVSDAQVTITDDDSPANTIQLVESESVKGLYVVPTLSEYLGRAGRTYTLTIEKDGIVMQTIEYLAPVVSIDSIQVHPSGRGEKRFLAVFTYGLETPGIGNFYKWDVYINDTLLDDAMYMAFASDEMVDGNYINGLEIFTDFHNPAEPSERMLKYNDTIQVRQNSISAFAYDYYNQLIGQASGGSMFSVPPANIKSNFTSSDGKVVLGLFTAHDVSVSEKFVIDDSVESQIKKD